MLDFGLPGGALHAANLASSSLSVIDGDLEHARALVAFAGFDGLISNNFGRRGRTVVWDLVVRAADLATLIQIERNMDLQKDAGEVQLTSSTGRVYERAVLQVAQANEGHDKIAGSGWVRRRYRLEWTVLSGD